jgi:predicted esterase
VDDVSYASAGGRVEGYLALPPGKRRVPGVIFLHGSGENRERFLLPAVWAAGRPGSVLLQDGRQDEIVPRAALVALGKAAPRRSVVRWYPAGHELDAQVYLDQLAFLARKLPIEGPPVEGARTGP